MLCPGCGLDRKRGLGPGGHWYRLLCLRFEYYDGLSA